MVDKIEIYNVMRNLDQQEGRGPEEVLCSFECENEAKKLSNDKDICSQFGVMGFGPLRIVKSTINIYRWADEAKVDILETKVKERALAKLTPAERKALGL